MSANLDLVRSIYADWAPCQGINSTRSERIARLMAQRDTPQ